MEIQKLNDAKKWNLHQMSAIVKWIFKTFHISMHIFAQTFVSYWKRIKDILCQMSFVTSKLKVAWALHKLTNNIFVTIAVHPPGQCLWRAHIVWSTFDALQNHTNEFQIIANKLWINGQSKATGKMSQKFEHSKYGALKSCDFHVKAINPMKVVNLWFSDS